MKENLTEIIFILDRSGSMQPLEEATISGYNEFLHKQSLEPGEKRVTTVLFDDSYDVLYRGMPLEKAKITGEQYFARGMTALYDAVGKTIIDTGARFAKMPESERPSKVIVAITTDGAENASREFTQKSIREMIEHQRDKYSWEFVFFGANIDVETTACAMGIDRDRAVTFKASPRGVSVMMDCFCDMVSEICSEEAE